MRSFIVIIALAASCVLTKPMLPVLDAAGALESQRHASPKDAISPPSDMEDKASKGEDSGLGKRWGQPPYPQPYPLAPYPVPQPAPYPAPQPAPYPAPYPSPYPRPAPSGAIPAADLPAILIMETVTLDATTITKNVTATVTETETSTCTNTNFPNCQGNGRETSTPPPYHSTSPASATPTLLQ